MFAALAAPFFAGRIYTADDLGAFHLPLRAFYAQALARGEPFDWMPQLFCGFYLSGEGQVGGYHPFHLAIYRLLPLRAAMAWELLASYPAMLAGMYWFLRRRLRRRDAAMFGAMVFTFSGFNLLHFIHPNAVAIIAHIPWLLAAIDVLLVDGNPRRVAAAQAGIALLTASQLLLGYPQYVWFSLLAEGAYACWLGLWSAKATAATPPATRGSREPSGTNAAFLLPASARRTHAPHWVRRGAALAFALLSGLLTGAIQLLPTFDAVLHSARRAPDAEFVNWGSLHPVNLVQLAAPYLFAHRVLGPSTHESSCYLGAVPLVLLFWLWMRRSELGRLRPLACASASGGGLAVLLAFGEFGPIYRFQQALPIVGGFRCPGRYLVLCQLATGVLAAIGFLVLVRRQERGETTRWREMKVLLYPVLASLLAAAVGLILGRSSRFASPGAVLAGPLWIAAAAGLLALAARGRRAALPALILLTAADLAWYGLSDGVYPFTDRLEHYVRQTRLPPADRPGRVLADLARPEEILPRTGNQMTMLGWPRADGYAGIEPLRALHYDNLAALQAAGVRWVRKTGRSLAIDGLLVGEETWLEVPDPLPRVRLVSEAKPSKDPRRDIGRMFLKKTALVDRPLNLVSGSPGVCAVEDERPGRLRIKASCPSRRLLVVSESYHSGWKASIDGQPADVLRANGDFLGCVVPPGDHQVVLDFQPDSLRCGRLLSCLGAGLILASFSIQTLARPAGRPAPKEPQP